MLARIAIGLSLGMIASVGLLAMVPAPQAPTLAQEAPQAAQPQQVVYTPSNEREAWAVDLLAQLGNTQPTPETIVFVVEWTLAEDGGMGAFERNNPLNTTMCGYNQVGAINSDGACGVAHYATYQDGLDATIATLAQGNFAAIAAALQVNNPESARLALWASPWAASHYNGGVEWPQYTLAAPQPATDDVRRALVEYALSLQGIPYVRGGRSATGGDCSGTMQHIYLTVTGIDIGATTFSQWPQLQPIDASEVLPGDLWYGVFPTDEHTGMVADVDGDGRYDLIHNGADAKYMHVTSDFLNTYLGQHTKGFRRAI